MNFISHTGNTTSRVSPNPKEGFKPCKFKGGKQHQHCPFDELDNLLIGNGGPRIIQRKHFNEIETLGTDRPPKPTIKCYGNMYQPSKLFQIENIEGRELMRPRVTILGSKDSMSVDRAHLEQLKRSTILGRSKLRTMAPVYSKQSNHNNTRQTESNNVYDALYQ